jgi:hypothetical protein
VRTFYVPRRHPENNSSSPLNIYISTHKHKNSLCNQDSRLEDSKTPTVVFHGFIGEFLEIERAELALQRERERERERFSRFCEILRYYIILYIVLKKISHLFIVIRIVEEIEIDREFRRKNVKR